MNDPLAPLRPLARSDIKVPTMPYSIVDHVAGALGPLEFIAMMDDCGYLSAVVRRPKGGAITKANLQALWKKWELGEWAVKGEREIYGKYLAFTVEKHEPEENVNMIEPIIDQRGFTAATCKCDICGEEARERAKMKFNVHGADKREMDEAQVLKKLQSKGWSYVKRVLRCPTCEAARKGKEPVTMIENAMTEALKPVIAALEPTREQKRQIMSLLDSVYDKERERYSGRETDASVAEALGKEFKVDWVSQIREEFFGADGNNGELTEIAAEIAELRDALKSAVERDAEADKMVQAIVARRKSDRQALESLSDRANILIARLEEALGVKL